MRWLNKQFLSATRRCSDITDRTCTRDGFKIILVAVQNISENSSRVAIASVRRDKLSSLFLSLCQRFIRYLPVGKNSLTVAAMPIARKRDLAENASRALWSIKGWRISPTPRKNKDVDVEMMLAMVLDGDGGGGGETYYALLSQWHTSYA